MPIYEYRCLGCSSNVEKMQKLSEAPLETCEKCGGKLEKQWSLSGFQFKGEGWYVTDYANKNKDKGEQKSEKANADAKTEKSSAPETSEKSLTPESTAKTETASKQTNGGGISSKKETPSKNNKSENV
ncbi:MAG: FmdB family zinc ribbon protein [Pyrinomonadaceae bacterium]